MDIIIRCANSAVEMYKDDNTLLLPQIEQI